MNIEKYTNNAQQAVMDSQNIALAEGNPNIDGEHIHLALLKQEDYENRTSLLDEFDQAVKAHNRKAEKPWEKVSLARGLATFRPGVDTTVEEVLRRADQRMYRDKRLHKEEAGLDRADNG